MSDNNDSIKVDSGSIMQVQNLKINQLTQSNTLLEARLLDLQSEVNRLNSELVKNLEEDITAELEK